MPPRIRSQGFQRVPFPQRNRDRKKQQRNDWIARLNNGESPQRINREIGKARLGYQVGKLLQETDRKFAPKRTTKKRWRTNIKPFKKEYLYRLSPLGKMVRIDVKSPTGDTTTKEMMQQRKKLQKAK